MQRCVAFVCVRNPDTFASSLSSSSSYRSVHNITIKLSAVLWICSNAFCKCNARLCLCAHSVIYSKLQTTNANERCCCCCRLPVAVDLRWLCVAPVCVTHIICIDRQSRGCAHAEMDDMHTQRFRSLREKFECVGFAYATFAGGLCGKFSYVYILTLDTQFSTDSFVVIHQNIERLSGCGKPSYLSSDHSCISMQLIVSSVLSASFVRRMR